MSGNEPRWVHDCSRCGVTVPSDRCEETCPVCQVAMATDNAEPAPAISPDELARKQRVVDAIGVFLAKPAKPTSFRRWRRPGFR
jgi:hypothetical protein